MASSTRAPNFRVARQQQRRHDGLRRAAEQVAADEHRVRGRRSATTPPIARKRTIGIMRAASTMPSADAESVSCSTANASATGAMALPRNETQRPANSSPKFRCRNNEAVRSHARVYAYGCGVVIHSRAWLQGPGEIPHGLAGRLEPAAASNSPNSVRAASRLERCRRTAGIVIAERPDGRADAPPPARSAAPDARTRRPSLVRELHPAAVAPNAYYLALRRAPD